MNERPELEHMGTEELDPNKSRYAALYGSGYELDDLPARLIINMDGTLQNAASCIFGTPCMLTDWDIDIDRRMYALYVAFPNSHPRYADGAQLRTYGIMAEMIVYKGVEVGCVEDMDGAISAAKGVEMGTLRDMDPNLDVYMEFDVANMWLTVNGLIRDLPKLYEMEHVLRRAESALVGTLEG